MLTPDLPWLLASMGHGDDLAVVQVGDSRGYGCFLIRKGVIGI